MPKSRSRPRSTRRPYAPQPTRRKPRPSPGWYGFIVLGVMAVGVAMIVLNYMNLVPGGTNQLWLWSGLGLIALGFGAATRWR